MDIDALVSRVKASREAKGLKSVYVSADGNTYDRFHPTPEHKRFHDFKYKLRESYKTKADVPPEDLAELDRLYSEMTKA